MIRLVTFVAVALSGCERRSAPAAEARAALDTSHPFLRSDPFRQAPVRSGPSEVLLLPGASLAQVIRVVYQRVPDTGPLSEPELPLQTTIDSGDAEVVSVAEHAVVVRLPTVVLEGATYALWAVTSDGHFSNGVRINDARPQWLTPPFMYASASADFLPRTLKVVGRNLNPAPGAVTRVRLTGPVAQYELTAAADAALDRFVARVTLPAMKRGQYAVSVTRDGVSWVGLPGQTLDVVANPVAPQQLAVAAEGCVASDGVDDTLCVLQAISHAASVNGEVVFGTGTWDLNPDFDVGQGIVVPVGVGLRGAAGATVRRAASWPAFGVFILEGANPVRGLRFADARIYDRVPQPGDENAFFLLGTGSAATPVDDVVFVGNVFAGPYWGILDGLGHRPMRRLFITDNEFGAYRDAVLLGGPIGISAVKFRVDDAVIARNTFKPGRYEDTHIHQGTIASEVGASLHLDFSDNFADGFATDYLLPGDTPGWRAAFFWHFNNNHEQTLVSNNRATCTGDKDGDGEFIVFDSNKMPFPAPHAQAVLGASANLITVSGDIGDEYPPDYFSEHWVFVGAGRGSGQAREVVSYVAANGAVTYTVAPAWEVVPDTSSLAVVTRTAWQLTIAGNTVSQQGCLKPHKPATMEAGVINLWTTASDSVIENNVQHESDGILLNARYAPPFDEWPTGHHLQLFNQVRGNTLDDEYDYGWTCSRGGIKLWFGASDDGGVPIVLGHGTTIAGNVVIHSDTSTGGAIAVEPAWYLPDGGYWDRTLIFGNDLRDIVGPDLPADSGCGPTPRVGIRLGVGANESVLAANTCTGCDAGMLLDQGTNTHVLP